MVQQVILIVKKKLLKKTFLSYKKKQLSKPFAPVRRLFGTNVYYEIFFYFFFIRNS